MKTLVTLFAAVVALAPAFAALSDSTEPRLRIDQLVALVPSDAKLKTGGSWQPIGAALANAALKRSVKKKAEFAFKVALLDPHPYDGHAIVMHSKPAPVTINGTSIPSVVYAYFDSDALEGLGRMHVGDSVTISGVLNRAEIQSDQSRLFFELVRARVQPTEPK